MDKQIRGLFSATLLSVIFLLCYPLLSWSQDDVPPELRTDALRIISPADGDVVAPGQALTIVVEVKLGSPFTVIGVVGERMGFSEGKISPPFNFTMIVPNNIIGPKKITAVGFTGPGQALFSRSVTVNVETPAFFKQMRIEPSRIDFKFPGDQAQLNIDGVFADGSILDITRSSRTSFVSENQGLDVVDTTGPVPAVAPGTTNIIVAYGSETVVVPVSVPNTIQGDLDANGKVNLDDFNILLGFLGLLVTDDWTSIPDSLKKPAVVPSDARDLNGDGVIDAQDVRILAGIIGTLADLSITNNALPLTVPLGRSVTYTISIVNNGPQPAPHVTVSDVLSGVQFVSSSASQGTGCSEVAGYVTCHLGPLKSKAKATVTIVAVPTQTGDILNVARVGSEIPDPNNRNDTASVTVNVTEPGTAGEMKGDGYIDASGKRYEFNFNVQERTSGQERGHLELRVRDLRQGRERGDDKKGREVVNRFASTSITRVVFSDTPGIAPGRRSQPTVDTVEFAGTGRWNGKIGYSFEARATDAGEPGKGRDTFAITVKDQAGRVVATVSGNLSGGNIQSLKARR